MEIAEIAVQQAKNDRGQLATLMLDIDHFKNVNDQYGHQAGDGVLSAVAASIRKSLRGGDVAGRYGGEEFIILLVGASSEQCFKIAERIRLAIARLEIPMDQGTVRVTVSLGLMVINTDQDLPVEDLIHCADQALYRAKQQGRNRTVAWPQNERSMDQETPHSNES
jgi:diguanylate cyclase (GGDEF)-like protein